MTEQLFLIEKRGLYYRPNAAGYTGLKIDAGRYSFDEAVERVGPIGPEGPQDGLEMWFEEDAPEFSSRCPWDVKLEGRNHALSTQLAEARAENERWRQNSVETWQAMCAMRDTINEAVPMPSLESDLLQGPENSVFYAKVAESVVKAMTAEQRGYQRGLREAATVASCECHCGPVPLEAKILALTPSEADPVREADNGFLLLVAEAMSEADRAMKKFPQPNYVISKVAEEAGEVVKAAIHCAEGREDPKEVVGEMRQCIAMLYRLWIEGDQVHGLHALSGEDS